MPNKVFTFIFSPPARMAWLTAKIYKVPTDIVQVKQSSLNRPIYDGKIFSGRFVESRADGSGIPQNEPEA